MIHSPRPKVPAVCESCGHNVPFDQMSESFYEVLIEATYHRSAARELEMLQKVAAFYERNPHLIDRIQPTFIRAMRSTDPKVRQQVWGNVPFDKIELPPASAPRISRPHPEDAEIIDYLKHNSFSLHPRMKSVTEQLEGTRRALARTCCPKCQAGQLYLMTHEI